MAQIVVSRRAIKRQPAGEALEHHDAERENIGPPVKRPAARLLGRHVPWRADDDAALARIRPGRGIGRAGQRQPREAKIDHFHVPAGADDDVGRLDVAVDQAAAVRRGQRLSDFTRIAHGVVDRQGSAAQPVAQRLPFDVLDDEEVDAVVTADVVERADVRMIEAGDRASFLLEARMQARVRTQMGRQDLQGHGPAEPGVRGAVNLAHAARANQVGERVRPELLAWLERSAPPG